MLFKGILGDQLSGSLAGIVASHNAGGTYFRERATPTDPGSTYQTLVRSYMAQLSNLWKSTLTGPQRTAWGVYASNVTVINRIGDAIHLSGLNHYIRSNVPRLQAGLPRVDAAPTTFNLGDFTTPTAIGGTAGAPGQIDFAYDNTDDWANEDDSALLVSGSFQQLNTINFYKGPYRYAGKVDGDSVTPPTSPAAISASAAFTAGNKMFLLIRASRADGRLSLPFRSGGVIT